mmetsp:Transcript_1642/g.5599  ORF Transcript_1642/g.5599 Transcript_1642/m.5599 type:complete len:153 (+) Transcript_1642:73-531(+)
MEALGMTDKSEAEAGPKEQPAEHSAKAPSLSDGGFKFGPLDMEEAKLVLEELARSLQSRDVQERLMAAWAHSFISSDSKFVTDVVFPLRARAWATCGRTPPADWQSEAWLPPDHQKNQDLSRRKAITAFLLQELPVRRAKQEAKKVNKDLQA